MPKRVNAEISRLPAAHRERDDEARLHQASCTRRYDIDKNEIGSGGYGKVRGPYWVRLQWTSVVHGKK